MTKFSQLNFLSFSFRSLLNAKYRDTINDLRSKLSTAMQNEAALLEKWKGQSQQLADIKLSLASDKVFPPFFFFLFSHCLFFVFCVLFLFFYIYIFILFVLKYIMQPPKLTSQQSTDSQRVCVLFPSSCLILSMISYLFSFAVSRRSQKRKENQVCVWDAKKILQGNFGVRARKDLLQNRVRITCAACLRTLSFLVQPYFPLFSSTYAQHQPINPPTPTTHSSIFLYFLRISSTHFMKQLNNANRRSRKPETSFFHGINRF
jgi:hypothetical protein